MSSKAKTTQATESLLVRPAEISDLGQLAELNLQMLADVGHTLGKGNHEVLRKDFISEMTTALQKPDDKKLKTLIAVNGADIINGFVEYACAENHMEIASLYAHEKHKGIGAQLISQVISDAREKKINQIYVDAVGDTVGFYRKMGFININPDPEKWLVPMYLMLNFTG